ncbi:MAG: LysE family translocator [Actinobacteria bacterium]|nr:LysE family translocator [Actinomycetota bacterium]
MPSTYSILTFAALSTLLIAVPGPRVLFVISRGIALGRRAALLTVLGNTAGAYTQILLVAFGLGIIIERSVAVFTAVKLLGAAYLAYLGVQAFRHRHALATVTDATTTTSPRSVLVEGYLVGVANPKLAVFLVAILPQYVSPAGTSAGLQMTVLGLVFAGIALLLDSCWALAAGTARAWLAGDPRRLRRLGGAGGLTMIGLGIQLAVSGRSD